jgi:hypothetical protein
MSMSLTNDQRTDRNAKPTRPTATIAKIVFEWIDRKYKDQRIASKKLAELASFGEHIVSVRTTEAWIQRRSPPCQDSIEIMTARCDDLARRIEEERSKLRAGINR